MASDSLRKSTALPLVLVGLCVQTFSYADQPLCQAKPTGSDLLSPSNVEVIAGRYSDVIGGCNFKYLNLPDGSQAHIIKLPNGTTYFLPDLEINQSKVALVQTLEPSEKLIEYGEVSGRLASSASSAKQFVAAKKIIPGLKSVLDVNGAHLNYISDLLGPQGTAVHREALLAPDGAFRMRIEKLTVSFVLPYSANVSFRSSGMKSNLGAILPTLDLKNACGSSTAIPVAITSDHSKVSGKGWEVHLVPYTRDVFHRYWALTTEQRALPSGAEKERESLFEQGIQLLLSNPYPELKTLLEKNGLTQHQAYQLIVDNAKKEKYSPALGFNLQNGNDPIAYLLSSLPIESWPSYGEAQKIYTSNDFSDAAQAKAKALTDQALAAQEESLELAGRGAKSTYTVYTTQEYSDGREVDSLRSASPEIR